MGVEIERKFLVADDSWRAEATSAVRIMQGYLAHTDSATIRVRIKGDAGFLTIKGSTQGVTRSEYEYPISVQDAEQMLATLAEGPVIDKVRHLVPVAGHVWEVDIFAGDNEGLVLAEVELPSDDTVFALPSWAGPEVSHDPRYFNVNLARHPYREWT